MQIINEDYVFFINKTSRQNILSKKSQGTASNEKILALRSDL
jgi:hypothetical protein